MKKGLIRKLKKSFKRGFPLESFMSIIVMGGGFFLMMVLFKGYASRNSCENDLDRCKYMTPEVYEDFCAAITSPSSCSSLNCKDFVTEKNLNHCFRSHTTIDEIIYPDEESIPLVFVINDSVTHVIKY